jgi:hypothetical protein
MSQSQQQKIKPNESKFSNENLAIPVPDDKVIKPVPLEQKQVKPPTQEELERFAELMQTGLLKIQQQLPPTFSASNAFIHNGKPVKLMVGIPATPLVDFRWAMRNAVVLQQQCPPPPQTIIAADNRYGIAASREAIFNQFVAMPDVTHLLFVDTDMILPDFAVQTLIQDDKPIVSAVYWNSLFTGNAAWVDDKPLDIRNINSNNNNVTEPLIQVDKVGFGCCLFQREITKLLLTEDRPLFYYKITEGSLHSEDFFFLSKIRKLGKQYMPWVDLRIQCQHIKSCMIGANGGVGF